MRLVFLAALAKTLHEVTIGLDLAEQLTDAGVASHFVVNPYNEDQLRTARTPYTLVQPELGENVREVVHRVVKEFQADAVVLVDYLAHWMTFQSRLLDRTPGSSRTSGCRSSPRPVRPGEHQSPGRDPRHHHGG